MNPYASQLGNRNSMEVIAGTSRQLERLVTKLGSDRIEQPLAAGKWSVRQILCHLADAEVAFAFRLRQALAEDHHVIQPFDQDKWASTYWATRLVRRSRCSRRFVNGIWHSSAQ